MSSINKKNLIKDKEMVQKYINYLGYYFRKFNSKSNCKTCYTKTEKEYHYIYKEIWNLIHCLAFKLETEISKDFTLKQLVFKFYNILKLLPCNVCKIHYRQFLKKNPLRIIKNNDMLQKWTIDLHNDVNTRLNKKIYFIESVKYIYKNLNVNV